MADKIVTKENIGKNIVRFRYADGVADWNMNTNKVFVAVRPSNAADFEVLMSAARYMAFGEKLPNDVVIQEYEITEEKPPEYLLRKYPWLKGAPKSIWIRFWEFPEEPPKLEGSLSWALEQVKEIYYLPLTKEEKYLRWAEVVTDKYYSGLLTEEEKTEYLKWEFGW